MNWEAKALVGAHYRVSSLLIYTIPINWFGRVYLLMTKEAIIIITFENY